MLHNKLKLDNGLKIITIPEDDSLAVTILILVEAGSKYESKEIAGLSHFLEHMCFKGTKNRPKAIDISGELDSIGAQYNAFTGHEFTGYYAKVIPDHFDKALDIVSDIYLNQLFNDAEIEKEKGVIIEEINMYEDLPQQKAQELIMESLYGAQPAGRSIAGGKETVRNLKKDNFLDYRSKHYVSSATTVVVAGNFSEKDVVEKIKYKFAGISTGQKFGKEPVIENQKSPNIVFKKKDTDQTHLVLAVRSFDAKDERNYAVEVLSQILGGGMSSRLFQRIREEMGAAYYVRSGNNPFTDHGFFEAFAGADNTKAVLVLEAIVLEMKKMKESLVDDKELERAKESLLGGLFLGLETSDSVANFYGGQEVVRGSILDPNQYAEKIRKVTAEEVLSVARDIFKKENLNFSFVGPFESGDHFANILNL